MHLRSLAARGQQTALLAVLASVTLAACGSSSSSSTRASAPAQSSNAAATGTSNSAAGGTAGSAQQAVAKFEQPVPFTVAPLPKRPPAGKTIAEVDCTLPLCSYGSVKAAAQTLGWHYVGEPFDLSAGPAAFGAALTRAIQAKPDYIAAVGVFPPATVASELAQAKQAGIPVMYIAGVPNNPAIVECSNCAPYFLTNGKLQMDLAVAKYGTGVNVVDVGDPTLVATGEANAGIFAEATRLGAKKPAILNVSAQATPAANAANVISYLQSHSGTQVILDSFPDELVALPGALQRVGLAGKVSYIVSGPQLADLGFLRAGSMTASIGIETRAAWWRAVDAAARLSVGSPVSRYPSDWWQIVTKQNESAVLSAGGGTVPEPPHYEQVYAKAWKVG